MSKVVKSVGRAISGVVKGVVKAVKGVVKGVGSAIKKIGSSKIGKVLLAAATIYFGGAAIMGAMGGAGASTGFFGTIGGAIKGAGAGISSAWSGLTGAAGAAMGGNFGAAGSSLSQGFMGANAAGAGAVGGVSAVPMNIAAGTQASGAVTAPVGSSAVAAQPLSSAAAGGGVAGGAGAGAGAGGSAGFFSDPLVKYAAVTGGTQLAAGAIQGYGQQKAMEEERAYQDQRERDERARIEAGFVPTQFGPPGEGEQYASAGDRFAPRPGATAPDMALVNRGLIGSGMNYNPTFGNSNMPVYNPAYAGMPTYRR